MSARAEFLSGGREILKDNTAQDDPRRLTQACETLKRVLNWPIAITVLLSPRQKRNLKRRTGGYQDYRYTE